MPLKDSLDSARARAGQAKQEAEREAALVEAVRRRAASEGVSIRTCVIEDAPGGERRCVEISQFKGTARCTDGDGINCRLALRYGFNGSREEVAP